MPGAFNDELPPPVGYTYYPVKMTLLEAVKYWWKVSQFKAEFSIGDYAGEVLLNRQGVTEVKDLCLPSKYEWTGTAASGTGSSFSLTVSFLLPKSEFVDPSYTMSHTEILPSISIRGEAVYFSGDSSTSFKTDSTYDPEDLTGELTFDSRTIPWSGQSNSPTEDLTLTITTNALYAYED
jgi:hypothetical protein